MNKPKLVRDKVPSILLKLGKRPVFHIASKKEYWLRLKDKLLEEAREFHKSGNTEELADVLEVLDAILIFKLYSRSKINEVKSKKAKQRGKFVKGIILEKV